MTNQEVSSARIKQCEKMYLPLAGLLFWYFLHCGLNILPSELRCPKECRGRKVVHGQPCLMGYFGGSEKLPRKSRAHGLVNKAREVYISVRRCWVSAIAGVVFGGNSGDQVGWRIGASMESNAIE